MLLLLKLPTGAMTAFLGLILLHGSFVPGLSALDSSDQILAWALLFGAAQQLVTGLVDKKAQSVLDSVGSTPMTAEHE
jgi:succinate-acetate transporter protein